MRCKTLIITTLLCIVFSLTNAQNKAIPYKTDSASNDSGKELVLHFRFDRSLVDSGYRSNRKVLAALHELFADSLCAARIDSIHIRAYSSPEGDAAYNTRLASRRARAVKGYLVWRYPHLDQYRIHTSAKAEDWDALQDAIARDTLVPRREEALQILALDTPDARKGHLLKKLDTGIPYRYITRKLLPDLRNASICTVYMRPMKHPETEQPAPPVSSGLQPDDSEYKDFQSANDSLRIKNPCEREREYEHEHERKHEREYERKHKRVPLLALKTNLLFDAALMPNIEAELPLGKRWSLNGELMFPWWLMDGDKYCLQILMGGLEGRYWLGSGRNRTNREVLTGHFLGLYAGGGKYDLQWDRNGYQGEFFIAAGLSYGYAHSIARNLRLEYNIGVGLLRTDYRHYHARDNYQTLLWQENGKYTWFGPTKLKISLVWLLTRQKKE